MVREKLFVLTRTESLCERACLFSKPCSGAGLFEQLRVLSCLIFVLLRLCFGEKGTPSYFLNGARRSRIWSSSQADVVHGVHKPLHFRIRQLRTIKSGKKKKKKIRNF